MAPVRSSNREVARKLADLERLTRLPGTARACVAAGDFENAVALIERAGARSPRAGGARRARRASRRAPRVRGGGDLRARRDGAGKSATSSSAAMRRASRDAANVGRSREIREIRADATMEKDKTSLRRRSRSAASRETRRARRRRAARRVRRAPRRARARARDGGPAAERGRRDMDAPRGADRARRRARGRPPPPAAPPTGLLQNLRSCLPKKRLPYAADDHAPTPTTSSPRPAGQRDPPPASTVNATGILTRPAAHVRARAPRSPTCAPWTPSSRESSARL